MLIKQTILMIKKYTYLFFCMLIWVVNAQQPVRVTAQMIPPYSVKLSDYATANSDRLIVNLLLGDVNEFNRQVLLKVAIRGNTGFEARSTPVVIGANPIRLDGGIPTRLSNIDLRPYFELENLVGLTPQQYSQPMPSGLYQFCFEVYDFLTGRLISNQRCATAYIVLNDPPFLNLPLKGENIEIRDPQNIIFTWTPRHINATNVAYEFTLAEIWDTRVDPQAAFLASRPLYQTTTRATTLLYGPTETPLLPDKTYAWRVRAIVTDGISELSLFKNNGYSEIYHFNYTKECTAPQFVLAKNSTYNSTEVFWQGIEHSEYQVQYRKKNGNNSGWFDLNAYVEQTTIHGLEANTTYEYRVGGKCGYNGGYTYSRIFEFTTGIRGQEKEFNCGVTPADHIANKDPLPQLGVNETFTAGEFPVTVKSVEGSNGNFSGWGYITVPYFADTRIRIEFTNIQLNTAYQLVAGVLVTSYDPDWNDVDSIEDEIAVVEELITTVSNTIEQLLQNGTITQTEADEYTAQVTAAESAISAYNDAEQKLGEAEETGDTAAIETAKENLAATQQEKEKQLEALQEVADTLKAVESSNNVTQRDGVQSDTYFDGVLPFSTPDDRIVHPILEQGTPFSDLNVPPEEKNPDGTFFISQEQQLSNGKRYIVSRSNMQDSAVESDAKYQALKKRMEALDQDQFLLWIHYDFKENEVKYKVAFQEEYYYNQIAQNELVQLYNSFLNFDFRGAIGSAIVGTAEYFDTLLLEFKDYTPFMSEELLNSGYTTYEVLQMVTTFVKSCGEQYTTQKNGLIPRCLWDQDLAPAIAYYAGFIDGAFETVEMGWSVGKFMKAWNPTDPYFYDPKAATIRQQTIDIVVLIQQLDEKDILVSTIGAELGKAFDKYLDETVALTPKARYNQGKLIFEVASFFFGVGEVKTFLKTGKITSQTLTMLRKLPKSYAKLIRGLKNTTQVAIKRIDDTFSAIVIEGQEIARMTKEKLLILEKAFLESVDDHLQPIGQLVTPEGMIVQMDDGRNISDRVFDIIKDTHGKYKAGVGKTSNIIDFTENFFKNVDEFALTFDKVGDVSITIKNQAFDLYKQGKWRELEDLFKKNNLNGNWPPANGGFNIIDDVSIKAGQKYDRYSGSFGIDKNGNPILGGSFTSPLNKGTPYQFSQRALNKPIGDYDFYYEIEVLKDLPFKAQNADVIPWFGQKGGAKQSMWKLPIDETTGYPKTWNKLADEGYIKITIKESPSGKFSDLKNLTIQKLKSDLNIKTSLLSKLGNEAERLENWFIKYAADLGEDTNKLLDDLERLIDDKSVIKVIEDTKQKGLNIQITRADNTNAVVSIQKTSLDHPLHKGRYITAKYQPTYKPSANSNFDVPLSKNGITPDFKDTKYIHPLNRNVEIRIEMSGKTRNMDFTRANAEMKKIHPNFKKRPKDGYTWHHMDDFYVDPNTGKAYCTMQLVKTNVHGAKGMRHSGSVAQMEKYTGIKYSN